MLACIYNSVLLPMRKESAMNGTVRCRLLSKVMMHAAIPHICLSYFQLINICTFDEIQHTHTDTQKKQRTKRERKKEENEDLFTFMHAYL